MVENVCEKETKGFIVYKEELHMTEVKTITTEEVQERLENGETLFLVDVREDEEVAAGKIPEAVHDLAKGHNGKLRIDVLEGKKDFMKVLEIAGFKKVNTPPIMMKNSGQLLKRNNELYSIAAQIFG
ncbi:rhodanese-like domain-containing protein [Bacillus sp. HC-Mk]